MKPDSLLGVWTGTIHNSSGWEMKLTLSIVKPFEIDTTLGIFEIPLLPCSGTFRLISIQGQTLELQAEKLQGDCTEADSDSLELLPDGTLLYTSKGKDWETQGILQRANQDIYEDSDA